MAVFQCHKVLKKKKLGGGLGGTVSGAGDLGMRNFKSVSMSCNIAFYHNFDQVHKSNGFIISTCHS